MGNQSTLMKPNERVIPYALGNGVNRGRIVLHADLNNFFASVECAESGDPEMWKKPIAVCGDAALRHGIVLAKNEKAKLYGVKTGETVSDAMRKCPSLSLVKARHDLYLRYSRAARRIYLRYTDRVEPFGIDEAWLELTECRDVRSMDDGKRIADEIRKAVKEELGITASVGVSDNKIFAKLGSDYRKPDATTVFSPAEYNAVIARLPVSELLYVGKSTAARLKSFGIQTIGQTAALEPHFLKSILGKNGLSLLRFCRGEDDSRVALFDSTSAAKSIGNSTTPPRDLESFADAKLVLASLCDTVCARMRGEGMKCRGIKLGFRDTGLHFFERQTKLSAPTSCARDLLRCACALLSENVDFSRTPLRSIGICAIDLQPARDDAAQLSFFPDDEKKDRLDQTVDTLRARFGFSKISTALSLCDRENIGSLAHSCGGFGAFR